MSESEAYVTWPVNQDAMLIVVPVSGLEVRQLGNSQDQMQKLIRDKMLSAVHVALDALRERGWMN